MELSFKFLLFFLMCLPGCQREMERQPELKPYRASNFFSNQSSARNPVANSVSFLKKTTVVPQMNKKTLSQGQQLFDIYCTACHGWTGHGDGIVIQRGYPAPISFHNDSFKTLPLDFYFNFISRGGTNMPPFSNKLSAEEIWTITYYIKALQLSENFPERLLNDEERKILRGDNE